MIPRLSRVGLIALVAAGPFASSAHALSCAIVGTTPVSFGAYDVFSSSPVDSTGDVTLHCTSVTGPDVIDVSVSRGGASTYARAMSRAGGGTLSYNLYTSAARTTIWGDGSGSTSTYGAFHPPDDTDVSLPLYGRVPALQDVAGGSYSDTVVVTVEF